MSTTLKHSGNLDIRANVRPTHFPSPLLSISTMTIKTLSLVCISVIQNLLSKSLLGSAKSNESILLSYQRMLSNGARTLKFEKCSGTEQTQKCSGLDALLTDYSTTTNPLQKYPLQTFKATVNFFPLFYLKLKYLEELQNSCLSFKPLEKSRRQGVGKLWNALCNGCK